MGVDDMDPVLRQLYLQKPYVKTTKKASLLATIFEEPVQKTKSKEPQLMAARGFKRYLDFESQSEFAKRRRKREQRAYSHQMQKQREQMAQAEPETQVNNCGRPKRRAASISEAATKVMTFFDSPPKPISRESFELSLETIYSKEQQSSAAKDVNTSCCNNSYFGSSSSCNSGSGGGGGGGGGKDRLRESRRRIAKPSRIAKDVREVVAELVEIASSVNDLVNVIDYHDHDYIHQGIRNVDCDHHNDDDDGDHGYDGGGGGGGGGGCGD